MSFLISLEGNIGSGKSTLLKELSSKYVVVQEDIANWIQCNDHNLLEYYYTDKTKHSFLFQSYVLMSRISQMMETVQAHPNQPIICERCHLSDLQIFVKQLQERKELNSLEYDVYRKMHNMISTLISIPVKGIIYNQTSPSVCLSRIHKRNRQGENLITKEYILQLHNKHESFIQECHLPIFVIDGNIDETNQLERSRILTSINDFVKSFVVE